jgi:hypothetical protein
MELEDLSIHQLECLTPFNMVGNLLLCLRRLMMSIGLFKLFHRRALIDYRRTFDPNEASIFFIPYDSAMDAMITRVSF